MLTHWKSNFEETVLDKGRGLCLKNKVLNLAEDEKGYTAAVSKTKQPYTVFVSKNHSTLLCSCPLSKSGKKCEHMAAVLYAIDIIKDETSTTLSDLVAEELLFQQNAAKNAAWKKKPAHRLIRDVKRSFRNSVFKN